MENLTHTFVGAVLGKSGLGKKTSLATPTLLIAANLQDIDILGGFFGQNYLDFHRGITHAAAGTVVLSLGWSATVWAVSRVRKTSTGVSAKFLALWYISLLGLLSHSLLDFLNDYGVRPWLPFNGRRYYGDLVSIVDPWIWIIFGSSLFLLTTSVLRKFAWMGLGLILTVLIVGGGGHVLAAVWVGVLVLALVSGRYLVRRGFNPARVSLAVFFIYLSAIALEREKVRQFAHEDGPKMISEPVLKIDVLPRRPGSARRWTVVMETPRCFYLADVGFEDWRHRLLKLQSYDKNWDDPCYQESLSQEQMAAMSRFARFPSVDVQVSEKSCTVYLRDLRYARRSMPGWGVARTTVTPLRFRNDR